MKQTSTLTAKQTTGLAKALRTSIKAKQAPAKTFESAIRNIVKRAKQASPREAEYQAMAERFKMKVLAIGDTTAAFATIEHNRDGSEETTQVLVYRIVEAYRVSWTPGPCIAKLDRQDMISEAFEEMAKRLVK